MFFINISKKIANFLIYQTKQKYYPRIFCNKVVSNILGNQSTTVMITKGKQWLMLVLKENLQQLQYFFSNKILDSFVLFSNTEHAQFFLKSFNKTHNNMKFQLRLKKNGFLILKHFQKTKSLLLLFSEKAGLVGEYTNFINFMPLE